ncbi:YceI family protein [Winogradskyella sp. PE311]|uniref:YceI family protein n=1 Tax=Winogradskyella sp. PE311 TaxID=3366943 RepID=UPI00397F5C70
MLRFQFLLISIFFLNFSLAQNSRVDFEIRNLGINVDGNFKTFSINADIDSTLTLKSLDGKITASSIKTGIDSRDEHLLKDDYFDVENHKYIILESTSITKKSADTYSVKANLSIKGKTKTLTIIIKTKKTGERLKLTSNFEINRRDFGVGGGSFVMSKTVKVSVVYYEDL